MKRILPFLFALILLASCDRVSHDEGLVRIALSSEPPTLDIMINPSLSGRLMLLRNVYERLFEIDESGEMDMVLSESVEFGEDKRSLSIKLREDVYFHDGSKMDEEDVVLSLNRWLDKYKTASDYVHGARFYSIGDYSVEIDSEGSLALFPYFMASSSQSAVIMSRESIENENLGLVVDIVGTGPFKLESYSKGEKAVLTRNMSYYGTNDEILGISDSQDDIVSRLEYYFVPEALTRRIGLESGAYDAIGDVMSYDVAAFEDNENIALLGEEETGSIALVFNKRSSLGSNSLFRKAVSLSLDFDALMKSCYGESGYVVDSNYMDSTEPLFRLSGDSIYSERDLERAKSLIKESGYNGESFRILTSNLSNMDKIAVYMKSALQEVGVESEIIMLDWAGMLEARKDESLWDIYISAFTSVPLPSMKSYLMEDFPGWIDRNDAERVEEVLNSDSLEEASLKWSEVQRALWESLPVIVPGHYTTVYALDSSLDGVEMIDGMPDFRSSHYKK